MYESYVNNAVIYEDADKKSSVGRGSLSPTVLNDRTLTHACYDRDAGVDASSSKRLLMDGMALFLVTVSWGATLSVVSRRSLRLGHASPLSHMASNSTCATRQRHGARRTVTCVPTSS